MIVERIMLMYIYMYLSHHQSETAKQDYLNGLLEVHIETTLNESN